MEAGIVGLPNIGKTTLFNALTGLKAETANYPFTTTKPNAGVAPVPDPRLALISQFVETQKIVPATLQLVDMPALVRGASEGEGMGNQFLAQIRNVDALVHVVRCFEDRDVQHTDTTIDPMRDIETVEIELIAADSQVVENGLDKAKKMARTGDKAALARVAALEKCQAVLADLKPVRAAEFDEQERRELRSYAMLTAKPVLFVANVGENERGTESDRVKTIRAHAEAQGDQCVVVCAKLEAELAELSEAERAEMLEGLGMTEPALAVVARGIYRLLGLHSFFTAGFKEVRAWPTPIGSTAPQAAGVIHSDFERGFIRVEVYHIDDLVAHKSEAAVKHAGKLRVEGKNYIVRDGDICHFLFNV